MRHLKRVSRLPVAAQSTGICEELGSDTQAKFCFTITFLDSFLLPVLELKDTGNGEGEGEA